MSNKLYLHDSIIESKSKGNENKFYKEKVIRYNFEKNVSIKSLKKDQCQHSQLTMNFHAKYSDYEILELRKLCCGFISLIVLTTNWPVK